MSAILDPLRVIDASSGLAGAWASAKLAEFGADVIRVEPPGGDPLRAELQVPYAALNRGKRSVEVDLATESGRETLDRLLDRADVFLHSWAPGEPEKLGFGWERLHHRHPALIVAGISAFGTAGTHRDLPAREAVVHAVVGSMGEQDGHRDGPIYEGQPFASVGAAYLAVIGVLASLYRRHTDGTGRLVETSLYDGALAYLMMTWGEVDGDDATPLSKRGGNRMIVRTFRCADGEYLGVHTGAVGAWGRAVRALGLEGRLGVDPHGRDMGIALTDDEKKIMTSELFDIFASKPRDEWVSILRAADVCAVEHLRPGEAFDAPQVQANGLVVTVDDPQLGPLEQVGPTVRFEAGPAPVPAPAPAAGQHTAAVLEDLADGAPAVTTAPAGGSVAVPLLDGVRILDLGAYYAGPYSSRILADLGADVIKLETVHGDSLRGLLPVFRACQAGKRSIAADLKDPSLDALRRALCAWADVVHHNMRPGADERLGVSPAQVGEINPDVVYLYAPGWGSSGPDRKRQSFAPMLSGYVGLTFEVGGAYNDPLPPIGNEDPGAGLLGAIGILVGLLHRQRTGTGQVVEAPQLNAALGHMAHIVRAADGTVLGADRLDPLQLGVSPTDRLFETADGWLVISAQTDADLRALTAATGVEILGDPRYATPSDRTEHGYVLGDTLGSVFATRTAADWLPLLAEAGVPAAQPVTYNNRAFLRDPENLASRRAVASENSGGTVREIGLLFRISDTAFPAHRLAPELGEQTEQILRWAGYGDEAIADAESRGVVRQFRG